MKYIIKKGRHFANFTINRLFPFTCSEIEGTVLFSKECLVEGNISGWNKLIGITSLNNHKNSGRLVWMSDGTKIRIAGYVYKDGSRNEKEIIRIDADRSYKYSVKYSNGHWVFSIDYKDVIMTGKLGFLKFKQFPFFGGQAVAPITMKLWLN